MTKNYAHPLPSKEVLDQLLKYDPETGEFFWRVRPVTMFTLGNLVKRGRPRSAEHACSQWNSRWAGKPALTKLNVGYCCGRLNYQYVLAHRVAWKIMTGADPIEIDHIDGNRSNNKWNNLRNGTRSDNLRNVALHGNNTSGYHGVLFSKQAQKWMARIHVGTFDSKEEAIAARKQAEALLGYSSGHGREAVPWETKPSKPGAAGVVWDAARECWKAQINVNGKHHFLGRFATQDEAFEARKAAEIEHAEEN